MSHYRGSGGGPGSGVRCIDVERLVTRRRAIALEGHHAGRWCGGVAAAAYDLAEHPVFPPTDEAWTDALDRLELELRESGVWCVASKSAPPASRRGGR